MRLGIKPLVFLARLLVVFFATYLLWTPCAPAYTQLLATLTRGFLHLTELSRDPNWYQATQMWVQGTTIYYKHRLAATGSGVPAEWVQANLVLLIPLMLATPAPTYTRKLLRFVLALGIALVLQVLDIAVTVKSYYASEIGGYSDFALGLYQFGDAFAQSMDTQLFPFVIWAGIHLKQLLGGVQMAAPPTATVRPPKGKQKKAKAG